MDHVEPEESFSKCNCFSSVAITYFSFGVSMHLRYLLYSLCKPYTVVVA